MKVTFVTLNMQHFTLLTNHNKLSLTNLPEQSIPTKKSRKPNNLNIFV